MIGAWGVGASHGPQGGGRRRSGAGAPLTAAGWRCREEPYVPWNGKMHASLETSQYWPARSDLLGHPWVGPEPRLGAWGGYGVQPAVVARLTAHGRAESSGT